MIPGLLLRRVPIPKRGRLLLLRVPDSQDHVGSQSVLVLQMKNPGLLREERLPLRSGCETRESTCLVHPVHPRGRSPSGSSTLATSLLQPARSRKRVSAPSLTTGECPTSPPPRAQGAARSQGSCGTSTQKLYAKETPSQRPVVAVWALQAGRRLAGAPSLVPPKSGGGGSRNGERGRERLRTSDTTSPPAPHAPRNRGQL